MAEVQVFSDTSYGANNPLLTGFTGTIVDGGDSFMRLFGYDPDLVDGDLEHAPLETENGYVDIIPFSIDISGVTEIPTTVNGVPSVDLYPFNLTECNVKESITIPSDVGVSISPMSFSMPSEPNGQEETYQGFRIDITGKFTLGPNLFITYRVGLEDVVTTDNMCDVAQAGGSITYFNKPKGIVETPIGFTIKSATYEFGLSTMLAAEPLWGAITAEPLESEVCLP